MIIVVVVSFLNEDRYLGTLLESMAAQVRRPDRLLLVDDGSTDDSYEMASAFAARNPYATVLRRPPRTTASDRLVGAPELRAFRWAVDQIDQPWDVVAKVDADVRLTQDLLLTLEQEFASDPRLGMAGSYLTVIGPDGRASRQRCPPDHVEGPTKFYRRECYDDISPIPAILGWDTIDEIRARMRGWRTASFSTPEGDSIHLRPMGSHDGLLRGCRRWGECAYGYGEHPLHVLLVGLQRLNDSPRVIGGLSYILGWAWAAVRRRPRAEPELRAYVRQDQLRRIWRRLTGGRKGSRDSDGHPRSRSGTVGQQPTGTISICALAYTDYASDPRVRREAEALARAGADVTVLALRRSGEPDDETIAGVRVLHLPVARYRGESVRGYLASYTSFFLRAAWYLSVRPRRFSLVHVHSVPEAMVFAAIVPNAAGRPVLLDIHDLSSDLYSNRLGGSPAAVRAAERLSLRFADKIVTVHDHYRNLIVERGVPAGKVSVVLNSPDEELFGPPREPTWPVGGPRLVYHGTFVERYGLGTLLDAFSVISPRTPGAVLELYGDGDFRHEIERRISRYGLGHAVKLSPGVVPVDEIPDCIAGAHIGVVPFLDDPFTASILPTKLLEYILMGIPAIVARNRVVEAYFEDDMVTFVRPGHVEDVVTAVEELRHDQDRALDMARRAQKRLREHSWEREQRRFLTLVHGMVKT
jgi:glycosyltransferase involved in cell wall biosynthesis